MSKQVGERIDVAGIGFNPITQEQLIDDIARHIRSNKRYSFTVYKPYVEFFTTAWKDQQIRLLLQRADRVVADGIAVQWAASYLAGSKGFFVWLRSLLIDIQNSRWRSQIIPERGAGVDATKLLLKKASDEGWSVAIFGGPQDIAHTKRALQKLFPQLKLVGVWSGYYERADEAKIISQLKLAYPDILFVAQGFPRQEWLIDRLKNQHVAKVMVGEGGTFDFDSMGGRLKRAPGWLRRLGLEWFWRLLMQPSRWSRQLALPRFVWRIYKIGQQK